MLRVGATGMCLCPFDPTQPRQCSLVRASGAHGVLKATSGFHTVCVSSPPKGSRFRIIPGLPSCPRRLGRRGGGAEAVPVIRVHIQPWSMTIVIQGHGTSRDMACALRAVSGIREQPHDKFPGLVSFEYGNASRVSTPQAPASPKVGPGPSGAAKHVGLSRGLRFRNLPKMVSVPLKPTKSWFPRKQTHPCQSQNGDRPPAGLAAVRMNSKGLECGKTCVSWRSYISAGTLARSLLVEPLQDSCQLG